MRLIDADAAIDTLNEQIEQCNKALGSFDILLKDEYAIKVERASLKAYKEQLENMPSAEPNTTTHDSIPAETGKNDGDRTSDDCISRQAVLDMIDTYMNKSIELHYLPTSDGIKRLISILPSAQPEQRWIPCSERQPDKGDDYLVTLWDDGRTWVEVALWNETFGGRWQAVLYNDVDYSDISNVIAWMPLPEPYQEESEDKE